MTCEYGKNEAARAVDAPGGAVDGAMKWCQDLLALPQAAMNLTRRQARADLVREFARDIDDELAGVGSWWWNQETQAALHRMVEQLGEEEKVIGESW
jgi:hypothetical protein